jgi:spore maturation protein CgeB
VLEFNTGSRLVFYDKAHLELDDSNFCPACGRDKDYRKALTAEQAVLHAVNGLAAALWKVRPHVLLSVSTFFGDAMLLDHARESGTRVVLLHTESPYEDERQLKLAPHADLNLVNDPTNLAVFESLAPTVYAPHAFRPDVHCPGPTEETPSDFSFIGTGYPSRIAFFEAMDLSGLAVSLGGNWMRLAEESPLRRHLVHPIDECLDNRDSVAVYRAAKCGLNLYRKEAENDTSVDGWALGPREVEMAATGLFFLREPRGEGDEVLDMLPTFESPAEASALLRWYLGHDNERETLAAKAREAIQDRTFDNHAAKLLRLLGVKE